MDTAWNFRPAPDAPHCTGHLYSREDDCTEAIWRWRYGNVHALLCNCDDCTRPRQRGHETLGLGGCTRMILTNGARDWLLNLSEWNSRCWIHIDIESETLYPLLSKITSQPLLGAGWIIKVCFISKNKNDTKTLGNLFLTTRNILHQYHSRTLNFWFTLNSPVRESPNKIWWHTDRIVRAARVRVKVPHRPLVHSKRYGHLSCLSYSICFHHWLDLDRNQVECNSSSL